MTNRYPLVANASTLVIEEIPSSDTLILENLKVSTTANLGAVGNITITGGSSGQVLKTNGSGVLSWGIDSASAGGNTTEIQYNNAGALTGATTFTFTSGTNTLAVGNITTTGAVAATGNVSGANLVTGGIAQITGNVNAGNGVFTFGGTFSTNANLSGNLNLNGTSSSINFKGQDGANTVVLQAPSGIVDTIIGWNLPNTQGNVGEYLTVNADAEMEWKTVVRTTAPGTAGATGQAGQIAFDSSYVYICIATNTWKRAAISTW
jgi:hypothetical protein